jgi:hypothetical protein
MPQLNSYFVGQGIKLRATYTNKETGALVDPSTVQVYIKGAGIDPQEVYVFGTDAEVTNPSVGVYEAVFTPTASGVFEYLWQGQGNVITLVTGKARVKSVPFTLV